MYANRLCFPEEIRQLQRAQLAQFRQSTGRVLWEELLVFSRFQS